MFTRAGFHYNKDPAHIQDYRGTKKVSPRLPLWSSCPEVTDIREFARACEDAGADALSW